MPSDPIVEALERALEANNTPELRVDLAKHLRKLGQPERAMHHYEKALLLDPGYRPALEGAIECARAMGRPEVEARHRVALQALGRSTHPVQRTSGVPEAFFAEEQGLGELEAVGTTLPHEE
ncbi:MAG: tetratricopeptide repeat protein [Myxococcota bacterium]|nr:tetratricopeptide repeat protein [Myxococcota bacterium]